MSDIIPIYHFALRTDLIDNKEFLPTRAEPKATAWDVRAAMPDRKPLIIKPLEKVKIPLGIKGFCPDGWWYKLAPRSSTFGKKDLNPLYGIVDETYEGELIFACQYIPCLKYSGTGKLYEGDLHNYFNGTKLQINFGEAIGQIVPVKRQEMVVLEMSNDDYDKACNTRAGTRGIGGFGSTDER